MKPVLRCATYSGFSTDQQRTSSIVDQQRNLLRHAQEKGWQIDPDFIFADEPLSSSGSDRPGLQHLLAAARRSPRPFDENLVDDTSRISRSMADAARIREELNFLEVRLVAVSQNIDSDDEQSDVMMTVHGLVDSLYIKELAKKTHEAEWVVNDAPGLRILSQ